MRKTIKASLLIVGAIFICGCHSESPTSTSNSNNSNQLVAATPNPKNRQLTVTSDAFPDGGVIPKKYTCDGPNISPPLAWSDPPAGTKSIVLIVDDPDAPGKTWVHWTVFNLPPGTRGLPENVPTQGTIASAGMQATTDFAKPGYGGPCPPSGVHRYFFKVYALDAQLSLTPSATKDELLKAMEGRVLAEGQLVGRYQR